MRTPLFDTAGCLVLVLVAAMAAGGPSQRRRRARRRAVLGWSMRGGFGRPGLRWPGVPRWIVAAPRRTALLAGLLAGVAGAAAGGLVGGVGAGVYGGIAARGALRGRSTRLAGRDRRHRLDGLSTLAADLRAGLPVPVTLSALDPADAVGAGLPDRLVGLARAAVRLAEQTGAPLADLLERIEADARATDRALAAAAAQAAGTRATAWLLAVLPLGGVALGYGIGADPIEVLLHTPIGAGCALGAIGLQVVGLAWTARLSGSGQRVV